MIKEDISDYFVVGSLILCMLFLLASVLQQNAMFAIASIVFLALTWAFNRLKITVEREDEGLDAKD